MGCGLAGRVGPAAFYPPVQPTKFSISLLPPPKQLSNSPSRKLFRYIAGDADTPTAGLPTQSPYARGPIGGDDSLASSLSPTRMLRKIPRAPFKVRLRRGSGGPLGRWLVGLEHVSLVPTALPGHRALPAACSLALMCCPPHSSALGLLNALPTGAGCACAG